MKCRLRTANRPVIFLGETSRACLGEHRAGQGFIPYGEGRPSPSPAASSYTYTAPEIFSSPLTSPFVRLKPRFSIGMVFPPCIAFVQLDCPLQRGEERAVELYESAIDGDTPGRPSVTSTYQDPSSQSPKCKQPNSSSASPSTFVFTFLSPARLRL